MPGERLSELQVESRLGGFGKTLKRPIPLIDFSNFEQRKEEISESLWDAAVNIGFFQIENHGIPNEKIDNIFQLAKEFFELNQQSKKKYPLRRNEGWESLTQIRPSTGTIDQKESYQITRGRMDGLWPEAEIPGFREQALEFEKLNWNLSQQILSCFTERLKLPSDLFRRGHDPSSPGYQSTLRFLNYYAQKPENLDPKLWRAGAHTDWTTVTLLYQRDGQGGLEVCPGRDVDNLAWTPIEPSNYVITCNVGDMLTRWSDDLLKSTLHRVRSPQPGDDLGARYSVVFFAQANEEMLLQGAQEKYPVITAGEFIQQRLNANFGKIHKTIEASANK